MSNEKLEALKWWATSLGLRWGAEAHEYGSMREEYAQGWARMHNGQITDAYAIGVEEGKREAYATAAKLAEELTAAKLELERLRAAAPVANDPTWGFSICAHCNRPLYLKNVLIADGCPCNSGRGVNHGRVPTYTCTCEACDPARTGSARNPQAAPVDDGRRYRLVYADGTADAGDDFSPGSLFTWATALEIVRVFNANPNEADVAAALVPRSEPKHMHEWTIGSFHCPKVGPWTVERTCSCNARQVAEWKDEP